MEFFKASVQYGDWEGTASADNADFGKVRDYFDKQQLIKSTEFLLSISIYSGEKDFQSIEAIIFEGANDFESVKTAIADKSRPIPVRRVKIELPMHEFLQLFKRFHVMLTWHGLELEGREYATDD